MRVTEQIDAMHSMAINPVKYLVSPRIVAGVIAMPLLTCMFNVIGIWGAYLVASACWTWARAAISPRWSRRCSFGTWSKG